MTTVTEVEPVTVTDLATPPLWHARRVTAGAAPNPAEALAALRVFGLMPDQLAGESAHLLALVDFDDARAINEQKDEEPHMATDLDTTPQLDMSPAAVRAWAKTRDLDVSPKGMVPRSITEAYIAAGGLPGTAVVPSAPTPKPAPKAPPVPMPAVTEPATLPARPEPAHEAGSVGRATVAGVGDGVLVFRIAHSARGEYGWVAATEWPPDRFGVVFEDDEVTGFVPESLGEKIKMRDRLAEAEERAGLPCPGTHCGEEATCPAAAPALPEPIADLVEAFHLLFSKASEVDTDAAHMLAEQLAPTLVRDTADGIHHLVRLLDGDVSR